MFTKKIKNLRQNKGLTQAEMAEKIDVARTTYAMYEQGKREPDFEILEKIADYFNVSTDYLLGRTDAKNQEELAAHRSDDFLEDLPEEAVKELNMFKDFIRAKYGKADEKGNA